jgi:hypothetical protein
VCPSFVPVSRVSRNSASNRIEAFIEVLDYDTKHRGLREFVDEVVVCLEDPSMINELLKHTFQEHELVSQFQRAFFSISARSWFLA